MVPGVLTSESPCRAASPERGWTSATYPSGKAIEIPVGTSARSPGARITSTAVTRSAPASPGWAYVGSGSPGSSRRTATGRPDSVTGGPYSHGWVSDVTETPAGHAERLSVPFRWWVQGTMLVATFWLAFVVATPGLVAWSATGLLLLVMVGLLLAYGAPRVEVESGWLRAGRARIAGEFVGNVEPLDAAETRRIAGPGADARAFLLLRPYLKRAVKVTIDDDRDPTPYWLVSTRDPEHLAAAIRVISSSGSPR